MASLASRLPVDLGLEPMEAKLVADLPDGPGWQFEPKWDGFRCLAFKAGDEVELKGRSGKSLARSKRRWDMIFFRRWKPITGSSIRSSSRKLRRSALKTG